MTKEEMASLAAELRKCGAALVKIAASLEVPAPEVPQKNLRPQPSPWKKCGRWRQISPGRDSRKKSGN